MRVPGWRSEDDAAQRCQRDQSDSCRTSGGDPGKNRPALWILRRAARVLAAKVAVKLRVNIENLCVTFSQCYVVKFFHSEKVTSKFTPWLHPINPYII